MLGGLPSPREGTERKGDKAFTKDGKDMTDKMKLGALKALEIARKNVINEAILKQRSPSCGNGQIYDGTFSGNVVEGDGFTAELLKANGIKVVSEEDI